MKGLMLDKSLTSCVQSLSEKCTLRVLEVGFYYVFFFPLFFPFLLDPIVLFLLFSLLIGFQPGYFWLIITSSFYGKLVVKG